MPRYPVKPNLDDTTSAPGGVAAVDRALMVLKAFREDDDGLALRDLSERTGLVSSTVLRLLASLIHAGYVERRANGRYALGVAVSRLHRVHQSGFNLEHEAVPVLRWLSQQTQESASLHVRQGNLRLVLYRVSSPQTLSDQTRAGDLLPLDKGSGGHVLMAFAGASGARFDRIRRDGYLAAPVSDRADDLAGISAAVFEAGGVVVGTVTLTMPAHRYRVEHVDRVREAAARLSLRLGGTRKTAVPG